ncbi:MAG: 23S rRNA (uracil(1939)-C(5))-methyltransferase RlmD [Cyanobacteria bacterium]|nr:23S rRNA (uracil(1939)-C(5))-methyltransferase RlmD [Cyanobacteriota bacterium]
MICKHFGICGGCTLPGVPYAEQLARKRKELSRLLGMDVPPVIPSPSESGFRSKIAYVFGNNVMGHYALGSQRIVPIEECPVHHERGNRIAFGLASAFARGASFGETGSIRNLLRHIIVRVTADGREASAMLVVTRNDKSLRGPVKRFLKSPNRPDAFFVNIHPKPGPFMVGEETIKIDGRSHVKEVVGGVSYLVSPTAFFQTNVGAAEILVKLVLEESGPFDFAQGRSARRVLDLYCGSGLFSLHLARAGATVTAIEENRQAIVDAEANVRLNRVPAGQIRFVAVRVEDALSRAAKDPWDAVVLDPPRQGCPPAVLSGIFERIRPARAVYVSCNPDALAKELPVILKTGYRVTRVQPLDMFPHTDHIETVVTFAR